MKTHLLGNEHQWIIESHYEDYEEFDYHWDKKVFPADTREDVSNQTTTYRGKQWNIPPNAFLNEWKIKLEQRIKKSALPYLRLQRQNFIAEISPHWRYQPTPAPTHSFVGLRLPW